MAARGRARLGELWWGVFVTVATRPAPGARRRCARPRWQASIAAALASLLVLSGASGASFAKPGKHHSGNVRQAVKKPLPKPPTSRKPASRPAPLRAAILIDAETGGVLHEIKPDMPAYPASLTKMMTLYLTFAALNQDTLDLNQRLVVSRHAARQEPSKLWLKVGDSVRVKNLILALVTRSANDAAVVLAEGLAGSEAAFAERMTAKARQLGMTNTVFRNASGLPDPAQRTTARDMARLALALEQEFPREFDYFSVREFEFRGQTITGHNHLLKTYKGSDGIKTGFTRAAGFNLVASAERNDRRLIGVILGSPSWGVRDKQMVGLLDRGFAGPGSTLIADAPDMVVPSPGERHASGVMARLATLASPIRKAEAAGGPQIRPAVAMASTASRTIQLGAFRVESAAQKLARSVSRLLAVKGKSVRVVKLPKRAKGQLYTVRLSPFTEKGAREVCTSVKKKTPCIVLPETDES